MDVQTRIINHVSTDRIMEIELFGHRYLIFTLMRRNVIVLDITNKNDIILLMNSQCISKDDVLKGFDKIAIKALNAIDNDSFDCDLGTYIHLNEITDYDSCKEIVDVYKIIIEDYNL